MVDRPWSIEKIYFAIFKFQIKKFSDISNWLQLMSLFVVVSYYFYAHIPMLWRNNGIITVNNFSNGSGKSSVKKSRSKCEWKQSCQRFNWWYDIRINSNRIYSAITYCSKGLSAEKEFIYEAVKSVIRFYTLEIFNSSCKIQKSKKNIHQ